VYKDGQTLVIQPGPYWGWEYFFQDDTIPIVTERYLKGNRVARITHFYNAAGQRILDSTYHTPNYGTFTYLLKYTYDAQGRLSHTIDLNDLRDSTLYTTYQYSGNVVEKREKRFYYDPTFVQYRLTSTEYVQPGVIATEKVYTGETPNLATQTDYSYDAAGRLLKKTIMTVGVAPQEDRYFYNDFGKVEKLEVYYGGQLRYVTTYYYE
jgi:YD repeat-containing protein